MKLTTTTVKVCSTELNDSRTKESVTDVCREVPPESTTEVRTGGSIAAPTGLGVLAQCFEFGPRFFCEAFVAGGQPSLDPPILIQPSLALPIARRRIAAQDQPAPLIFHGQGFFVEEFRQEHFFLQELPDLRIGQSGDIFIAGFTQRLRAQLRELVFLRLRGLQLLQRAF